MWAESEMSSKADMSDATGEVRFVPKGDIIGRTNLLTNASFTQNNRGTNQQMSLKRPLALRAAASHAARRIIAAT